MNVVVVESPAKAKTINKYLGGDYQVLASFGHVRDLPSKDGSVRPDEDFAMDWAVDSDAAKRLSEIAAATKNADTLILATDPDREGEAISWHVLEVLRKKGALEGVAVKRVVFNAITKSAVLDAMANPRDLDMELVDAYLARRALDYLVGFTLSPVLWRKVPGARSAGRVQSVALRLVCDRELEIEKFKPQEYWSVAARVSAGGSEPFDARLVRHAGEKIERLTIGSEAVAMAARRAVETGDFTVTSVEAKPARRNPAAPFTTSTLQQEASRKLGFSASRTMQMAQRLYEAGLITYMRTDGVQMAGEAIGEAREMIAANFGRPYLPDSPRQYTSKAKNAQEAHEAIRPTDFHRDPKSVDAEPDQAKLYGLIWNRAVASQMESARLERTTIDLTTPDGATALRATGTVILFDGFLTLYSEGRDEPSGEESEGMLPKVEQGAGADVQTVDAEQHFTQPPPRYSEASLVKRLEELGIGRPSTYASTLSVLRDRAYVRMEKGRFVPEDKGRVVTAFLENFFQRYVEYDFTADLEEKLDKVSAGELEWKVLLREFWDQFSASVADIADLRIGQVIDALNETLGSHLFPDMGDGRDPRACPSCATGRLSLKFGRYGGFVGCSNYPECKYTRQLAVQDGDGAAPQGDRELGADPETGLGVTLKSGRFGPYVERADEPKPKRASIPKGWEPGDVDLEKALKLLSLPREIGMHPEDGAPIVAGLGRFGPYLKHGSTYANLTEVGELFDVGVNRAVALLADKKAKQGGQTLRDMGEHPEAGGPVKIMKGRYGPYVKHGKINASLPKDVEPDDLSMEQALALLTARGGKSAKKKPAKKAAAKKPAAKKAPAKKAAKKSAAKKPAKKAAKKAGTGED
jgi:DNA topoisomerase-1